MFVVTYQLHDPLISCITACDIILQMYAGVPYPTTITTDTQQQSGGLPYPPGDGTPYPPKPTDITPYPSDITPYPSDITPYPSDITPYPSDTVPSAPPPQLDTPDD